MPHLRRPVVGLLVAVAALVLAGCTGGSATANLPSGSSLLASSGAAMRSVTSVHFTIDVNGTLAGVPIQNADGDLNAQGAAKGSAKISEFGAFVEVNFVLVNGTFFVQGPTGGYQRIPAALAGNLFDPTAILDPNRGIAKVLTSVRGATTKDKESVNGTDTYRITGKVARNVVSALVPGISSDVGATVWVASGGRHLPVKAEFAVPGRGGAQGAKVDVSISKINAPVTVTAPV